ncbi:hypothetical protein C7B67_14325 [filamentous cyanobacterium Phorm 6]|nr:hypothetical protein C7B67_14325 [filamentous cyanobacterium Phorm 6]
MISEDTEVPSPYVVISFLIFQKIDKCWRSAILPVAIVWGVIVVLSTEIFSLFRLLTFEWVFGLWLVVDILGFIVYLKFNNVQPIFQQSQDEKLPSVLIWLLGAVSFIFAAIGLIAIVSPPNNWDSIALGGLFTGCAQCRSRYPTSYVSQLDHPLGAEFAIMHFPIITGGDRFANLIQWLSMVGSAILNELCNCCRGSSPPWRLVPDRVAEGLNHCPIPETPTKSWMKRIGILGTTSTYLYN